MAGRRFGETFAGKGLAESYRAVLITAARRGEAFSTDTGLPESLERERRDVSFYAHCLEFTGVAWAGHSVEVLRRIYHHSVGGQDEVLIARMDAHRRRSLWRVHGAHMGDGIRHQAASVGNAWHSLTPPRFTSSQVRGRLALVKRGAPSRIRTYAPGSGGG